jgi:hypothetical protein
MGVSEETRRSVNYWRHHFDTATVLKVIDKRAAVEFRDMLDGMASGHA